VISHSHNGSKIPAAAPKALGRCVQLHGLRRVERFARHTLNGQVARLLPRDARLARIEADGGQSNYTYLEGNAYDIFDLVDCQVDLVFLANAFHGVPDKPGLARAVGNVLKPDGYFVIVNWHAKPREETTVLGEPRGPATELRIHPEAVDVAVRQAGLRPINVVEIPPYHYASIFAKG
jgi:SAM-dependent methyltransferase